MGETRVDLAHLLEDLRDAYPGTLEDTILTEIVANALDSAARTLDLETDSAARTLIARDDGAGMTRRELARYHDLGASSKRRGRGIGFAGIGIKLGLLACDEVVTETQRAGRAAATTWRLASRARAPWSWIEPPHMLEGDGTAVLLRLANPLSPLLDPGFLESSVLRHFQPLFEPEFIDLLASAYPHGFSLVVNRQLIVGPIRPATRHPIAVRIGRQRKPTGIGYLARHDAPLPEHERGLAISTLGKVIRRGWDWLGLTPLEPERVEGLIEVPALADALTLNKGDFMRHGARGALFLSYRKAIQEAASARFEAWGAAAPPMKRAPRTRPLERDIRQILGDLAGDYPLLATLVERTAGGQRRLPLGEPDGAGGSGVWGGAGSVSSSPGGPRPAGDATAADRPAQAAPGSDEGSDDGGAQSGSADGSESRAPAEPPPPSVKPDSGTVRLPGRARTKRPATLSLQIRFESLPDSLELGRLIQSTIRVNDAHPAYRRAVASRAEGYHIALAVASALAPLAVEAAERQRFVSAFLARWGDAGAERRR